MMKNPYLKNWFIDARNECFGEPLELSETGDFWGRYLDFLVSLDFLQFPKNSNFSSKSSNFPGNSQKPGKSTKSPQF
jgi:hypothetical protein